MTATVLNNETRTEILLLPLLPPLTELADEAAATVINIAVSDPFATMINPELAAISLLNPGDMLLQKYTVERRLNVASGEADLYVVNFENTRYIAKLYKRKLALKPEVAEILKNIDSPHIARLFETAEHNGYPVEIIPYYANGSLQGRLFSLEELKSSVIPALNNGLKALHVKGLLHKDLKPSNIMLGNDGQSLTLIDFGISSVKSENATVIVTRTGLTPEYSAPETFRNLFLEESDYYSLGVTLCELYCGYSLYANMAAEEIAQYVALQKMPLPEDMPRELQELIAGLTYYDITQRHDRHNPNRRWTFDEVERWCKGERLTVPGLSTQAAKAGITPYRFKGTDYTDINELTRAWIGNWDAGKKEVFRGHAAAHFKALHPEAAAHCLEAEEQARTQNGKDDLIFWRLLYRLNPGVRAFYWRDRIYESLPALGREMLEKLWQSDYNDIKWYQSILSENLLSAYVDLTAPDNTALKQAVAALESHYRMELSDRTDLRKTYFLMAYLLSGQKILGVGAKRFRTIGELSLHLQDLLDHSVDAFRRFCHLMVDYHGNLDSQMEAWLIAQGKHAELNNWHKLMAA